MGAMLTRVTLRGTLASVRYVEPVPPRRADGLVAAVYRQVQRDFGMLAPPLSLHAPAPPVLAATWMLLRESLLVGRPADRAVKESVAAAVSAANDCPYCVEVHGTTLRGLAGRRAADRALAAAGGWARSTGRALTAGSSVSAAKDRSHRGRAQLGEREAEDQAVRLPPAPVDELAAVAVTFHYLNRMVNIFLDKSPLPGGLPAAVTPAVRLLAARTLALIARRPRPAGDSLALLSPAPLPDDLAWAAGNPVLGEAFGRAAAAYEDAGERSVPPAVRALVLARLAEWDGTPPGVSAAWATREIAALAPADRAAVHLALLTALASYQVTPAIVERVPDGRQLVEITAWASFSAARRLGNRPVTAPRVA